MGCEAGCGRACTPSWANCFAGASFLLTRTFNNATIERPASLTVRRATKESARRKAELQMMALKVG